MQRQLQLDSVTVDTCVHTENSGTRRAHVGGTGAEGVRGGVRADDPRSALQVTCRSSGDKWSDETSPLAALYEAVEGPSTNIIQKNLW